MRKLSGDGCMKCKLKARALTSPHSNQLAMFSKLSVKGQIVNIFGFVGYIAFVTIKFCYSAKFCSHRQWKNEWVSWLSSNKTLFMKKTVWPKAKPQNDVLTSISSNTRDSIVLLYKGLISGENWSSWTETFAKTKEERWRLHANLPEGSKTPVWKRVHGIKGAFITKSSQGIKGVWICISGSCLLQCISSNPLIHPWPLQIIPDFLLQKCF